MNPQHAEAIAQFLLGNLEAEIPTTIGVFGAVPEHRLDYRPDPISKTALGLLRHLTLEDEWLLNAVADGSFGPFPDESDACGIMTPGEAVARYRERIPAAAARVRALSGDALLKDVSLGPWTLPAVQFLAMMVRHSVHHRGQLSAYLRAMGGKVPSIYGPSADTQTAAAAEPVTA